MNFTQDAVVQLENKSFTPGTPGTLTFQLTKLPVNRRATFLGFLFEFSGVGGAPGPASVRPNEIADEITAVVHASKFLEVNGVSGRTLDNLIHAMFGRKIINAAQTVSNGVAFSIRFPLLIPLFDPRSVSPTDFAIDCDALRNESVNISANFSANFNGNADVPVTTITCQAFAITIPDKGAIDPAKTIIGKAEWGQSGKTPKGVYSDLFAYNEDGSTITDAEVATVDVTFDGAHVLTVVPSSLTDLKFNLLTVPGGFEDNDAEQLESNDAVFKPIIAAHQDYKLSELPACVAGEGSVQTTGTQTSVTYGYRYVGEKDTATVQAYYAEKLKAPPDAIVRSTKTVSKMPLNDGNPRVALLKRILPGRGFRQ